MPADRFIDRARIQGVVLCGGKSSRFGSPKAFFEKDGVTLVERALRVMRPLVDQISLAIGDWDSDRWPDVAVVPDRISGIGPMGGLHALLHEMTHEWLLVLPVDIPSMPSETLSMLVSAAQRGDLAVVAVDEDGRLHPLCALYHRSMRSEIDAAVARKQYSPTRLLSGMNNVRYVTFPDESLRNANRPEDLGEG